MIHPTRKDLNRAVTSRLYRDGPDKSVIGETCTGRIVSIDRAFIGVLFDGEAIPKARNRVDLSWKEESGA